MTQKKLSVNIIYSLIVQISAFIAPLITAPYIARVLTPGLIGEYSYVLANSSYFVLVQGLGLTLYGSIRTASIRDDKEKLSQLFWEIFFLRFVLMAVCAGGYTIWFVVLDKGGYRNLYIFMLLNLLTNGLDITWILNGLEEFKVTAIRGMAVRIINVAAILVFVKGEEDFYLYVVIMQVSSLLGCLAVYPNIRCKIVWPGWQQLQMYRHLLPSLIYFVPGLVNTIFSSTDKTILGLFTGSSFEVGIYEQANKICQLCMGMISAVSNVILPRVTYLYHNSKDKGEVTRLLGTSLHIAVFAAMPVSFGIAAVADNFVPVFFGKGYEKSAVLLKILCLNVLFVALSNFIGQQCLIARGKQKEYNISISVGALLNVVMNICLVNIWKSAGVAIASAVTGFVGLLMVIWFSREMISMMRIVRISGNYFAAAVVMFLAVSWVNISDIPIHSLLVQIAAGVMSYFVFLLLLRDKLLHDFLIVRLKRLRKSSHG